MSQPRLILFDIDCTLLRTEGSGMRALSQALAQALERPFQLSKVAPCGLTDPKIVQAMLAEVGLPPVDWSDYQQRIFELYPALLGSQLQACRQGSRLEPGVEVLLEVLHGHPDIYLGVLTGNLEVTARMKLEMFNLNHYFPIGAFGSDEAERNSLGPIALERARRHYGCEFQLAHTWFVGDTHLDIQAARACGARVLAVATGNYSQEYLLDFSPDHCREHLLDIDQILELLLATDNQQ